IAHRSHLKLPVIGITGTNGKTTTKELIACVLKQKYRVASTTGNFNNHIGVPLTILSIDEGHDVAVVEMGANHPGEIATLCGIANPDYGLITNIGKAHLEGFRDFEGIVRAKRELYDFISASGGKVFVNADDALLMKLSNGIERILYGTEGKLAICGELLEEVPFIAMRWKTNKRDVWNSVETAIAGAYNFENLLSAICIGDYLSLSTAEIRTAFEEYKPPEKRSQVINREHYTLFLDCYNANPVSMHAAIMNLIAQPQKHKIAILGDMLELGKYSLEEHEKIIDMLHSAGVDNVYLVGSEFCKAAGKVGFDVFRDTGELIAFFQEKGIHFPDDSVVLIKASRGIALEKLLDIL
ncbi:MAG: UDP-N-acetylmuramoyl-tripeptide--D-alanyl-D-alanine ligase, partial [Flavobacteriales bacterium]